MSQFRNELCCLVLRENFGDLTEKLGWFLLRKGPCHLKFIVAESGLNPQQVKKVLCTLIQQNIVSFSRGKKGYTEYVIDGDAILSHIRFPKYIYCAKTLYGDASELLVEELLHKGQSHMSEVVSIITDKLNEALDAAGHARITTGLVQEKFTSLAQTHFIKRCLNPLKMKVEDPLAMDKQDEEELYRVPSMDLSGNQGRKRKKSTEDVGIPAKRSKTEGENKEAPVDDEIYWKVNFERFHRHFRDQVIVSAAGSKIDKKAGEVLRTMLRVSETKTDPLAITTNAISVSEVFHALPKDLTLTRHVMEMYISMLADDSSGFVSKVDESSGGMYVVNIHKALGEITKAHIETVVQERFGSKCLRIFRVLLLKNHLEQKQIEDYAMISAKEAKELLYTMFSQNFVSITEVSKTPDHAPSRTFYLFHVDLEQVTRMVLQRCYKAVTNAMIHRDAAVSEHRRLLDKKERVDAIAATLTDSAQKEEIEQTITPPERDQIQKVKHTMQMLDQSELQLDDTIFVLETFLFYQNQKTLQK